MGKNSRGISQRIQSRLYRAKTRQIVAKLPNHPDSVPAKRDLRKNLVRKPLRNLSKKVDSSKNPSTLKVGSINVDGLDTETENAVRDILVKRGFDVRFPHRINFLIIFIRF